MVNKIMLVETHLKPLLTSGKDTHLDHLGIYKVQAQKRVRFTQISLNII